MHSQIHHVLVILLNAQIALGDAVGRMVVQFHQQGWLNTLFPCVIAKGFAQGMTADMFVQPGIFGSFFDYAEGLGAGQVFLGSSFTCKKEMILFTGRLLFL